MGADGDALVAAARAQARAVGHAALARSRGSSAPARRRGPSPSTRPPTGVLTKKDVVPGMRVNAGDMPFEIVDLSRVWVLADVYESDLRHVKVGMPAKLTLKAVPEPHLQGAGGVHRPAPRPEDRAPRRSGSRSRTRRASSSPRCSARWCSSGREPRGAAHPHRRGHPLRARRAWCSSRSETGSSSRARSSSARRDAELRRGGLRGSRRATAS